MVRRLVVCALFLPACDAEPVDPPPSGDCWGAGDWTSIEPADMLELEGISPDPSWLSPDGLTLLYTARTSFSAPHRVFEAKRSERSAPFAGGAQLAAWPGLDPIGHPWRAGDELFMNIDHGDGVFELFVSQFDGTAAWSTPESLGPVINQAYADTDPTLTEDARHLMFARSENNGTINVRLQQATRNETGFADVREAVIPVLRPDDVVLCATLSPDGRRLFFSTNYPHDLSALPPNGVTVWFTQRERIADDWGEPEHIATLDAKTQQSCPTAITADGCELWVQRFIIDGPLTYIIARRSPTP